MYMLLVKRAVRRSHRKRILKKRIKEEINRPRINLDIDWCLDSARVRVNTGKRCSCWMCVNPRKSYGHITIQEKVIRDVEADSLQEYFD